MSNCNQSTFRNRGNLVISTIRRSRTNFDLRIDVGMINSVCTGDYTTTEEITNSANDEHGHMAQSASSLRLSNGFIMDV